MSSRIASAKLCLFLSSLFVGGLIESREAAAEKILSRDGDWTLFSDGRAGGFISYVRGDGYPNDAYELVVDPVTGKTMRGTKLHDVLGGGLIDARQQGVDANGDPTQGTLEGVRVRSGMTGSTFGLGVRGPFSEGTTAKAYVQVWAFIENDGRNKTNLNQADIRQFYLKLEGGWGSLLVGRSRGLFSRGATDISVLYGQGFGVGFPGSIDGRGPTQGHVGFGVLGSGFAAGVVYATPSLAGLQLTTGAFDPLVLGGGGSWTRTKWPRVSGELVFDRPVSDIGKVVLFANGEYQKVYQPGTSSESVTGAGFGYGGRLELGPFRLGVAGHRGVGLGLNYALEVSPAAQDRSNHLRWFDGYYVQSQVSLGKTDVSAGWGITRVFLNPIDNVVDPMTGQIPSSILKYQQGLSAGVVYHLRPWLHVDVDFFRAEFAWFLGEKQTVNIVNSGMLLTW